MTNLVSAIRESMRTPFNMRRRLLVESQYTLPSSGNVAVMDLYALYSLWWAEGEGKESYGYNPESYRPHRREELVGRAFEDCLSVVSTELLTESREAIKEEAANVFDEHLITPDTVVRWAKQREFLRQLQNLSLTLKGETPPSHFGYQEYMTLFSAPFWAEEADFYGGDKWVNITRLVMKLDHTHRRGTSAQLMGAVDALLDVEHNTGALAGKLTKMKVDKETLDLRAGFTSPADFLPYVSGRVATLIKSSRP